VQKRHDVTITHRILPRTIFAGCDFVTPNTGLDKRFYKFGMTYAINHNVLRLKYQIIRLRYK